MGGSSAPQQRPSAQEKALAAQSAAKDARYEEAFRPLEQAAIDELSNADAGKRSAMIAGRQNADLENMAAQAKITGLRSDAASGRGVGSGDTVTRSNNHAGALAAGKDSLRVSADQAARDSIDQDTLNVIKTGQNISRQSQSSLTHSARMENATAAQKLASQQAVDQAKANAIMQTVSAAGIAGGHGYKRATQTGAGGQYEYGAEELNLAQTGLRKLFGNGSTSPTHTPLSAPMSI